ncbi:hypothetical protein TCAL_15635 [Tigriopus californicus]|uniref:Uncharacterized protein n=1 Tax=Tigriopus californicus TaxID=6832 RepID=A0A553PAK8_TIGCA|nr:hypothetical protein TCAL_15635 [Tigriopus californicus]
MGKSCSCLARHQKLFAWTSLGSHQQPFLGSNHTHARTVRWPDSRGKIQNIQCPHPRTVFSPSVAFYSLMY